MSVSVLQDKANGGAPATGEDSPPHLAAKRRARAGSIDVMLDDTAVAVACILALGVGIVVASAATVFAL
jgi:hypothetical protein